VEFKVIPYSSTCTHGHKAEDLPVVLWVEVSLKSLDRTVACRHHLCHGLTWDEELGANTFEGRRSFVADFLMVFQSHFAFGKY
jgi:hypothetical protein